MTNPVRLRNDPDPIQTWTIDQVRKWRAVRRPWSAIGRDLKMPEAEVKRLYGWVDYPEPTPREAVAVVAAPVVVKPGPAGGPKREAEAARLVRLAAERHLQMPVGARNKALAVAAKIIARDGVKVWRHSDRFSLTRTLAAAGYAALTGGSKRRIADAFGVHGCQLAPAKMGPRGLTEAMVAEVCAALKAFVARGRK